MNRDGIYPDDRWQLTERDYAAIRRQAELLEYADVVLMGQQVTGDDPPDGVVVGLVLA